MVVYGTAARNSTEPKTRGHKIESFYRGRRTQWPAASSTNGPKGLLASLLPTQRAAAARSPQYWGPPGLPTALGTAGGADRPRRPVSQRCSGTLSWVVPHETASVALFRATLSLISILRLKEKVSQCFAQCPPLHTAISSPLISIHSTASSNLGCFWLPRPVLFSHGHKMGWLQAGFLQRASMVHTTVLSYHIRLAERRHLVWSWRSPAV